MDDLIKLPLLCVTGSIKDAEGSSVICTFEQPRDSNKQCSEKQTQFPFFEGFSGRKSGSRVAHCTEQIASKMLGLGSASRQPLAAEMTSRNLGIYFWGTLKCNFRSLRRTNSHAGEIDVSASVRVRLWIVRWWEGGQTDRERQADRHKHCHQRRLGKKGKRYKHQTHIE